LKKIGAPEGVLIPDQIPPARQLSRPSIFEAIAWLTQRQLCYFGGDLLPRGMGDTARCDLVGGLFPTHGATLAPKNLMIIESSLFRAYARACNQFFAWCEDRGLTLTTIRPFDVAAYIETLQQTHSPPGVKQQLAAVRMLFDWLITPQ
jgi:hypothetical protein